MSLDGVPFHQFFPKPITSNTYDGRDGRSAKNILSINCIIFVYKRIIMYPSIRSTTAYTIYGGGRRLCSCIRITPG